MLFQKILKAVKSSSIPEKAPEIINSKPSGKRTCVYFTSWSIYEERNHFPEDVPLDYVTNIFLAFANINPQTGEVVLGDKYADLEYEFKPIEDTHDKIYGIFAKFVELQRVKYPYIKISLSIGGWSNRDNFSKGLSCTSKLKKFIESSIDLIKKFKLNGIDLDWEYPQNQREGDLYLTVIKSLREKFRELELNKCGFVKDSYLVTIASPAFEDKLQYFNLPEMDKYLNFWNLMTYDFAGEWSDRSGYHCNLFKPFISYEDVLCADDGVKYLLGNGIKSWKINLGMANYGRSFTNTEGLAHRFNGVGMGSSDEKGIWNYNVIMKTFKPSEIYYDSVAVSAYVFCKNWKKNKKEEKNLFIGFDNVESIKRKAQYVQEMNLGGGMWWESCGDTYKDENTCLLKHFVNGIGGKEVLLHQ